MSNLSKFQRILFLAFSLVILTTACNTNRIVPEFSDSKPTEISEKTKGLIQKLKDEDAKLSDKTLPTDISIISEACHEIFYSIMSENDSIGFEPDTILDTDSNMYIKIGNSFKIDNNGNRLIEFGKKNPAEGSSTKVYIQSFDDKSVSLKEVLDVYTDCANIARVDKMDIYSFSGKYYAVVSDLMFDVNKDRDYIRLTLSSWTNNSWENVEIAGFGDYKNPYLDKGNTYSLESTDKGLKILIKDSVGKVLNHRFVDFTGEILTIKLFDKNLLTDKDQGNSNNMTYEITKATYTDKNIKINYPQLKNMSDINKQKAVNDKIKSEALKGLNYYGGKTSGVTLDINYSIEWKGQRLLSIQYSGIGSAEGATHPNSLFYSTNIDLISESILKLKDLVNIDNSFVEKFKNGVYRITDSQASPEIEASAKRVRDELTADELIRAFNNADSLDNIGTENHSDTFTYFTKNSLGIEISVPHVVGDYAEFLISY